MSLNALQESKKALGEALNITEQKAKTNLRNSLYSSNELLSPSGNGKRVSFISQNNVGSGIITTTRKKNEIEVIDDLDTDNFNFSSQRNNENTLSSRRAPCFEFEKKYFLKKKPAFGIKLKKGDNLRKSEILSSTTRDISNVKKNLMGTPSKEAFSINNTYTEYGSTPEKHPKIDMTTDKLTKSVERKPSQFNMTFADLGLGRKGSTLSFYPSVVKVEPQLTYSLQKLKFEELCRQNKALFSDEIIKKLGKKIQKKKEYELKNSNTTVKELIKKEQERNDSEYFKQFIKEITNPSNGNQCIEKRYPVYFQKYKSLAGKSNKFCFNYDKKTCKSTLVAQRINKEVDNDKYKNSKNNKFAQISKLKLKWHTIKWLLEKRKENVDKLLNNQSNIFASISEKPNTEGMGRKEFGEMIIGFGITTDEDLINKLFWIFDEDGSGDIDYKEIAFGIEMFIDSPVENKLKTFFDLCDVDNKGLITKHDLINLLRKNLIDSESRIDVARVVDKIFSSVQLNENKEITYAKLIEGANKNNGTFVDIFEKNLKALHSIEHSIDSEVKNEILNFNPELNVDLRSLIINKTCSTIPSEEKKFEQLIENYVDAKHQKLINFERMREDKEAKIQERILVKLSKDKKTIKKEEEDLYDLLTKPSKIKALGEPKSTLFGKLLNKYKNEDTRKSSHLSLI